MQTLFHLLIATTWPGLAVGHISVSLTQRQGNASVFQQAQHASIKHSSRGSGKSVSPSLVPETLDSGFWFGAFDVGEAKNLSLLIDTGSADVAVNPNLYEPSNTSHNLDESGHLGYATVQENGCGKADMLYHTFSDIVSQAGLSAQNQTFGNIVATTPPDNGTITKFPHEGIVGFAAPTASGTQIGGTPFFKNLCDQGAVGECRFGLAFETSGTGTQVLGGVDEQLVASTLTHVSTDEDWVIQGNTVVNESDVLEEDQNILLDSGTANIVGPPSQVRSLFETIGIQAVEQNLPGCTSVLFGYYPCHSPPKVGFQLGDTTFNIEGSAFQQADNGGNNCTAIVTGIDFGNDFWILGQAWFQGKYVDFDVDNSRIGVAPLKNTTNPAQ